MHVQGGVHVSIKVTQAARILAFVTFWVIQSVTLIIRADQHIFGKCCSAESETVCMDVRILTNTLFLNRLPGPC